jgi:ubiquinone/menaquinone biosynthesis C-methylase UbiE
MLKKIKKVLLDYSTPQHYYFQNIMKNFSKKVGHIPFLIDVGCGQAPFLYKFSYNQKVLIDIEKGIDDIDFLCCDVQALAIKDGCADMVLLNEVLEHVEDEKKALSEIYRVLRPGGFFVISVPFLFGIHEKVDYRRWTEQGCKNYLKYTVLK